MTKNFNTNTDDNDEWLTPPSLVKSLGVFDLDPCSPIVRPWDTAKTHFDKSMDGLSLSWFGRVWLNPPYGRETGKWVDKLANHGDGVALVFARTETKLFQDIIFKRADAILFINGRIKFHYVDGRQSGPANAPSVLVAFGPHNVKALEQSSINGKFLRI